MLATQRDERDRSEEAKDRELKGLLALTQYRKANRPEHGVIGNTAGIYNDAGVFTPTYTAPAEAPSLIRSLQAGGIDPKSAEGRAIITRAAPGFGYSPEVLADREASQARLIGARTAGSIAAATGGAEARAKFRAPAGGGAPSKTPPKYAPVPAVRL